MADGRRQKANRKSQIAYPTSNLQHPISMFLESFYSAFDARVQEIVAFGYAHSPAFHARMETAHLTPADIQTAVALAKLPILRKEELITQQTSAPNLGGMTTQPLSSFKRIFQSPGPIHDPEANELDQWRWAPALRAAGIGASDLAINCFGYHLTPAGVMFEEGARAVGCCVIPAGIGNHAQQIQAIETLGVTTFVGLPSYLKGLLEKAREQGHDYSKWHIRKAIVAAEPCPPSLRKLFQDEYGIEVFNVYGTAECGNLGWEDSAHNGWILPSDALVQVCDLNTGEPLAPEQTGEVVVTLFRQDYILIRLGMGDLSALMSNTAEPRLVGWLGRSGDSVKVRGIFVHPRHVDEAVKSVAGIARYQAVVSRTDHRDELTVSILPEANSDADALRAQTIEQLHEAIKLKCHVEIVSELAAEAKAFVDERDWK